MQSILLVDDSPTMLMSLADILTKAGHLVETAKSAEAALVRLTRKQLVKLIITDYHMPGGNGVHLVRETRKMPSYRHLPILLLTTEAQPDMRNDAKTAGATGWLVKPVANARLIGLVEQLAPGSVRGPAG